MVPMPPVADPQEAAERARQRPVAVPHARAHLGDDEIVARSLGEEEIELAVRRVLGMEGETEQAALSPRQDPRLQIEERHGQDLAAFRDLDDPALLDDEQSPRSVTGIRQKYGIDEPRHRGRKPHLDPGEVRSTSAGA